MQLVSASYILGVAAESTGDYGGRSDGDEREKDAGGVCTSWRFALALFRRNCKASLTGG